jgi:hypothetical protein
MMIDIDTLTEPELIDLNHRIVARLRLLNEVRAHAGMLEFRIGDRVGFQPPGRGLGRGDADAIQQEDGDDHHR